MKAGDVVIASLLQADGEIKTRPAILLCELPGFGDYLLCGVSSRLRHYVEGFDQVVRKDDPDFHSSGLLKPSLIRLGYLEAVPTKDIVGVIGRISVERHRKLLVALADYLRKFSEGRS